MSRDDVHKAPLRVLHALGDAIAASDPDRVLALFDRAHDVVMFGSEGPEIAYGYDELDTLWRRVLARGQSYVWRWRNEKVEGVADVAWVSAEADVDITTPEGMRTVPYRATIVVRRLAGEWRICQYHGSEPADAW